MRVLPVSLFCMALLALVPQAGAKKRKKRMETRYLVQSSLNCVEAMVREAPGQASGFYDRICGCAVDELRTGKGKAKRGLLESKAAQKACYEFARTNTSDSMAKTPYTKKLRYNSANIFMSFAGCHQDVQRANAVTALQSANYCICVVDHVRGEKKSHKILAERFPSLGEDVDKRCKDEAKWPAMY